MTTRCLDGLLAPRRRRNELPVRLRREPHDVALELQLVLGDPGGGAEELREVQDRELELAPGLALGLPLPRVEREVAERARRDHHVGAGVDRLLEREDRLAEGDLLAREDDREAAALHLRGIVDRLGTAGRDETLERGRAVGILEA